MDRYIFHQANLRILEAVGDGLGIPADRVFIDVDRYGNTAAASVPIALHEAVEAGLVREVVHGGGDVVHGDDVGVAAEEHEIGFPVVIGVGDEVADLLRLIDAGVVGVDALQRHDRRRHAAGLLGGDQVVNRVVGRGAGEGLARDGHVLIRVGRIAEAQCQVAGRHGSLDVTVQGAGIGHLGLDRPHVVRTIDNGRARSERLRRGVG